MKFYVNFAQLIEIVKLVFATILRNIVWILEL